MEPARRGARYKGRNGPLNRIIRICVLAVSIHFVIGGIPEHPEQEPEFLAALGNQTATQGRDVTFTCVVNHLGPYRVAWIKSDSKAILAIHTHMVAHNARLAVTHNGHNAWKLHIANVQRNDSGVYMCQINTDPMRNQMGYLDVVVPPDILNEDESSDSYDPLGAAGPMGGAGAGSSSLEGGTIKLRCPAVGVPRPSVSWRREDSRNIVIRTDSKLASRSIEGETLILHNIQRSDMGAYLCIASNGVPPSVSKRFIVQVHFHPVIRVANQLVGAPAGRDVTLECVVEASPKAMNSWYRDSGDKILPSSKHVVTEHRSGDYTSVLTLTVKDLRSPDFGGYVCASVNALGRAEAGVRLQELQLPKSTTTPRSKPSPIRPSPSKKPPTHKSSAPVGQQSTNHGQSKTQSKSQRERDWSQLAPPPYDVTSSSPSSLNEEEGEREKEEGGANHRRPGWVSHSCAVRREGKGAWFVLVVYLWVRSMM